MNNYTRKVRRRIEDALNAPPDMLVCVVRHLNGVRAELQPEVGRIYPAVRGASTMNYRTHNRKSKPFCYININGHPIIMRGGSPGEEAEYKEVFPGG